MDRWFLVELQNRPDGITNSSINSYSTQQTTRAMFYQRCAAACSTTQFVTVALIIVDAHGNIIEDKEIITSYVPPEPEPEPEPEPDPE